MENKDKSAFPEQCPNSAAGKIRGGLTKREYIAGLAMQGLLADPSQSDLSASFILGELGLPKDTIYNHLEHYTAYVAKKSVAHADAILKELSAQ